MSTKEKGKRENVKRKKAHENESFTFDIFFSYSLIEAL